MKHVSYKSGYGWKYVFVQTDVAANFFYVQKLATTPVVWKLKKIIRENAQTKLGDLILPKANFGLRILSCLPWIFPTKNNNYLVENKIKNTTLNEQRVVAPYRAQ
jgi:hypothetical protein